MVQFTHQTGLMPEVFVISQRYLCKCQEEQQKLLGELFHHSTSGFTFGITRRMICPKSPMEDIYNDSSSPTA